MNDSFIYSISDDLDDVYFLEGELNGKYPYSHSILIKDVLIDTGISTRFLRKLKRQIKINKIILSHWHEDHISGNRIFPEVPFLCHPLDKAIIEDISKMKKYYDLIGTSFEEEFEDLMKSFRLKNVSVSKDLKNGEILNLGNGYELEIIHTPGHTAGHCCFYEPNYKFAFLADIDLSSFPFYGGVDSNLIEFENSIQKIKGYDINIAISAHKGIIKGKKNILQGIEQFEHTITSRDKTILNNLMERQPINSEDLVGKNLIYKKYSDFKEYELIAERIMIEKHFQKFMEQNIIEKKEAGYILI